MSMRLSARGASTASIVVSDDFEYGGRIILPASLLHTWSNQVINKDTPVCLKLQNTRRRTTAYCGVRDFTADEGVAVVTEQLMRSLQLVDGDALSLEVVDLPPAESCTLQLTRRDLLRVVDQRAVLEEALSAQYTTLSRGEVIKFRHDGNVYGLLVKQLEPAGEACCIVGAELSVELVPPPGMPTERSMSSEIVQLECGAESPTRRVASVDYPSRYEFRLGAGEHVRIECETVDDDDTVGSVTLTQARSSGMTTGADFEVYASGGWSHCREPSRSHHDFAPERDSIGHAVVDVRSIDAHTVGSVYITVIPFGARERAPHSIRVLYALDSHSGAVDMQSESSVPSDNTQRCGNCHQSILTASYALHTAVCARNNTLCPICAAVVRTRDLTQHVHCTDCGMLVEGTGALEKHRTIRHTPLACDCGLSFTMNTMTTHRRETCVRRISQCRYCGNLGPVGEPPSDHGARMLGLTAHEVFCGGRTERCRVCNSAVRVKDLATHAKVHEFDEQHRKPREHDSSAVASVSDAQRHAAWSAAFPVRGDEQLRAALHQQQLSQPLLLPVQPPPPAAQVVAPSRRKVHVRKCPTVGCWRDGVDANIKGLCVGCRATLEQASGSTVTSEQTLLGALVRQYFRQATQGCGRVEGCSNRNACCTADSVTSPPFEPNESAHFALTMAREDVASGRFRVCANDPRLDSMLAQGTTLEQAVRQMRQVLSQQ